MSIGEVLANARRRAGLSVTQVSQRTRIGERVIAGIEGDDYSVCGGDFYARGHIRAIAAAVGADPEPLIGEYDAARLGRRALTEEVTEPAARGVRVLLERPYPAGLVGGMTVPEPLHGALGEPGEAPANAAHRCPVLGHNCPYDG